MSVIHKKADGTICVTLKSEEQRARLLRSIARIESEPKGAAAAKAKAKVTRFGSRAEPRFREGSRYLSEQSYEVRKAHRDRKNELRQANQRLDEAKRERAREKKKAADHKAVKEDTSHRSAGRETSDTTHRAPESQREQNRDHPNIRMAPLPHQGEQPQMPRLEHQGERKGGVTGLEGIRSGRVEGSYRRIQEGSGLLKAPVNGGQLEKMLSRVKGFKGVFSFDRIKDIPFSSSEDSCAVINTDEAGKPGAHWVALWCSPVLNKSVEVYDSLVDLSPLKLGELTKVLREITNSWNLGYPLKLKVNEQRDQRANSITCALHCVEFIFNRARGKSFAESTGYKSVTEAEDNLKPLVKRFKYL